MKNKDGIAVTAEEEEMIDISDAEAVAKSSGKRYKHSKHLVKEMTKKTKIILVSSISVVVIVALAVAGVCIGNINKAVPTVATADTVPAEFTFSEGTVVSGVSIAGKTVEEAKELLESKSESFITPLSVNVNINDNIISLTQNDFEYTYDIDSVLATVKADEVEKVTEEKTFFSNSSETEPVKTYTITATVTEQSISDKVAEIEEDTNTDPKNACVSEFNPYSDNRFEYAEAKAGIKLDAEDLNKQLTSVFASGLETAEINAITEDVEASIQLDDVKNNIVKLSTYETVSYNTSNGTSNMDVALSACNGSVIEPGDTWSFNACTGDSNLESNGYKAAHVISEGEIIDGIGGGICQASSTIYNAAVRANLDFEERYCHQYASTYVPTGLDATIDYPNLDLKISNPTDYQVFLECELRGTTLTVTFWGYKSPSYDYILTENELTSTGSSSYSVHAWRVYYKNGSEIDREELSSSEYDSKNGVIFYTADNDSRAKDVYSDSSSSSSSSGASDSSNSSDASSGNNYSNSQTSSNNSDSYSQGTSSNDNHNDNNSDDYSNSNNSDDDTGSDTSQAEPEPPADVPSDSE